MERKSRLDINEILETLPQRHPFLFIDRVIHIDTDKPEIICLKNITINDYFFKGHFPENPVMPGVIILEAMAQASIILFAVMKPEIAQKKPTYYFGKSEVKFLKSVKPGDRLEIAVEPLKILSNVGMVKALARVKNEEIARAQISFGVRLEDKDE